mgnify:CR=1 FL=1
MVPVAPSALNGFSSAAVFTDVPTVFAGRLGDTAVALSAAMLRGKVAVFGTCYGTYNTPQMGEDLVRVFALK